MVAPRRALLTPQQAADAVRLREQGFSVAAIGAQLGVREENVTASLRVLPVLPAAKVSPLLASLRELAGLSDDVTDPSIIYAAINEAIDETRAPAPVPAGQVAISAEDLHQLGVDLVEAAVAAGKIPASDGRRAHYLAMWDDDWHRTYKLLEEMAPGARRDPTSGQTRRN